MKNNELVNELIKRNLHITTCESCTGGLIASSIVDVSGSSAILNEAYVTYAVQSKINLVGVDSNIIEKYGVVSEETAYEMAYKASIKANSDIAISTTGVAGPTGGDINNPVGTVCFGFKILDKIYTERKIFSNLSRNEVRQSACEYAINFVLEKIKNTK